MKRLSKILFNSYSILIILQFLTSLLIILFTWSYMLRESKVNIKNVKEFFIEELSEPDHQDIDFFYRMSVSESPEQSHLYIKMEYRDKVYQQNDFPEINYKNIIPNKIQKIGYFGYYNLYCEVPTLSNEVVKLNIVRDLSEEKHFITGIIIINIFVLAILISIEVLISKRFLKKINEQLTYIEGITEKINIKTTDISINNNEFYSEFSQLIISYKKMVERLREQISLQSEFVHNASHELKTPLFIINSYLAMLKKRGKDDNKIFDDCVTSLTDETKNMIVLTEKLLFLSNSESNELTLEKISIQEMLSEIITEFNVLFPKQELNYLTQADQILISDRNLIKQLLRNLISNAIKYGKNNPIEIYSSSDDFNLNIKIKDHGIGISDENQEKIFNKFYMVDSSREQELKSHGLGLNIVKKILGILSGDINIISKISKGTTVELRIPISSSKK